MGGGAIPNKLNAPPLAKRLLLGAAGQSQNNIGSLNPVMPAGMPRSFTTFEAQRFPHRPKE